MVLDRFSWSRDRYARPFASARVVGTMLSRVCFAALAAAFCGCASNGDTGYVAGNGWAGFGGIGPSFGDAGIWSVPDTGTTSNDATTGADSGPSLYPGLEGGADGAIPGNLGADSGQSDTGAVPDSGGSGSADAAASEDAGGSACSGGKTWLASDDVGSPTSIGEYAQVRFVVPTSTEVVALKTTLTVPARPTSSSTLYAWPGIEPGRYDNIMPVGIGVLQPVLTWGTSCGDYAPTNPTGWWISPQYVNIYTSLPEYNLCHGGKAIYVDVGDELDITMSLDGTLWSQQVVDRQTGETTSFDIDLMGQTQNWALFEIEITTENKPVSDVVFTSTTVTFADPAPEACQPSQRGPNDYYPAPQSSPDGTKCCISRIILRAEGVPATTPNTP